MSDRRNKTPLHFEIGLARPSASRIEDGDLGLSKDCRALVPWDEPHFGDTFRGFSGNYKINKVAPYRSMLANDMRTLLDADPDVESYNAYPHVMTYQVNDPDDGWVWKSFTPDLVVRLRGGGNRSSEIVVIEVRAEELQRRKSWIQRLPYIQHAYWFDHGVRFLVYGESEIRSEPKLSNCKRLNALRWQAVIDQDARNRVLDTALRLMPDENTTTTVEDLVRASGLQPDPPKHRAVEAIANLILEGWLFIDHRVRWNERSVIHRRPVE